MFLLLGGVIALPYLLLVSVLGQMLTDEVNVAGSIVIALVAAVLAAVPPFLGGTREVEIAAARALLGVDLPDHDRGHRLERETRVRAALWFGLHMLTGVLIGAVILIAVPMALLAFTERLGLTDGALTGLDVGPLSADRLWWWTAIGVLLLIGTLYATAGLGALATAMAPVLLGPSPAAREALLAARERKLAERNRLARELHDSVGHALTAATLQAGAARAVFDTDPEFARRALGAIEELGRTAMDELDTVLGILRESPSPTTAAPTLADLDRLLTDQVDAEITLAEVSAPVSREAYRIVQESLTNAAKHGGGRIRLRVTTGEDLVIEVTNPVGPGAAPSGSGSGGRGVEGMRERVRLLGGELTAAREEDTWRVTARLPV